MCSNLFLAAKELITTLAVAVCNQKETDGVTQHFPNSSHPQIARKNNRDIFLAVVLL